MNRTNQVTNETKGIVSQNKMQTSKTTEMAQGNHRHASRVSKYKKYKINFKKRRRKVQIKNASNATCTLARTDRPQIKA